MARSEALTLMFFIFHFPVHRKEDGLMKAQRKYKGQRKNIRQVKRGQMNGVLENIWSVERGLQQCTNQKKAPEVCIWAIFVACTHFLVMVPSLNVVNTVSPYLCEAFFC